MKYMGLLVAPLAMALYMNNRQEPQAECEASRADKIRGNYENKIRFFAAPEKVFEIFASEMDGDDLAMSYGDFLHALTPYNMDELMSSEEIDKYLEEHEIAALKFADADNNKKISYAEFLFFLTVY